MAGETELLGENLPRHHFVHHKFHLTISGIEPGPPRWELVDSYFRATCCFHFRVKGKLNKVIEFSLLL
jgi:hypothetical protein